MTLRVCDRCKKDSPIDSPACPHCGNQFGSHEATLRCKIHGVSYTGRVSATGEVLTGHCSLCMETDDQEIINIDKKISTLQQKFTSIDREKKGMKDLRFWGIGIFILTMICGLFTAKWGIGISAVAGLAAIYLAATFFVPFLPLSSQWINAPKKAAIQDEIQELMHQKEEAVQRSLKD